jgi:hypothetical protein
MLLLHLPYQFPHLLSLYIILQFWNFPPGFESLYAHSVPALYPAPPFLALAPAFAFSLVLDVSPVLEKAPTVPPALPVEF